VKDNAYAKMTARLQSSLACHAWDTVEKNWLNEKIQLIVAKNSFWPFLLNFIGHNSFVCLNIRYTRLQSILHKLLVLKTHFNNQNVYGYFKWIIISFKSNFHRISSQNFNSLLFSQTGHCSTYPFSFFVEYFFVRWSNCYSTFFS